MADSEAHGHLSVTPPKQIHKDAPGFDSSIPLSPQWLLPKPGESKGTHSSSYSCSKNQADSGNFPGGGEKAHDPHKKKDVYRPTFLDNESARRDRWRDEERETNMSVRRDRWREGDKELGDARKMDRWTNNSSVKNLGEARRLPLERWVDQSKDAAFDQRRESKWSTRWGPNDKEMDKRTDFGKNADASHDRGMSPLMNHGKDERDGDHVRPWRPNFTMSRGRTDPPHHQSHITSKEGHSFGHGRGDNAPSTYLLGCGRIDSDMNSNAKIPTLGQLLDKADNGHGEAPPYRYDRTKLLDLYRVTNTRLLPKMLDAFSQVPPLTQEDLVEPFALCVPTPEELDILSGIDKGDIISSGVPQKSKDGSVAQGSSDFVQTRLPRLGGRDDVSLPDDGSNKNTDGSVDVYASFSVDSFHDKQTQISGSKLKPDLMENHQQFTGNKHHIGGLRDDPPGMVNGVPRNKELDIQGHSHSSTAWKSSVEHPHSSTHGWFDAHAVQSKASEIGWSEAQKMISGLAQSPYPQNEIKWQRGEDHSIRRQQSVLGDREMEARKLLQLAPEDLLLYYKDPQGLVQGPFPGIDIIGWFEAGYFGIDLPVRLLNAPPDYPFISLGNMMPHLRAKARPPPGFSASTPNEMSYISTTTAALSNIGNVLTGPNGIDMVRSDHKHANGSMTDAEKRYLESLMSSGVSSSPLDRFSTYQGSQGYTGNNSSALPPMGIESGGDSLNALARLTLDRQKSMSNSYPNWPIKDAQSIGPHSENLQDPSISHQKVHSGITDLPHQPTYHPQNVDLLSVLQGLPDSSTVSVNNGVGGWSNFPSQSGSDPNLHHNQNLFPQTFGLLQQRVQPQNHPSLGHMFNQNLDSASNIITPENLLSSSLSQDPQILDLLHQKQLLQMQPQTSQQLSILDKILLFKQQQQEEQLRLQQHQLLSQVLTEHHQHFSEPPYGQLHPTMIPQQILQAGPQVPVSSLQEDRSKILADNVGSETSSMHLPHHVSETRHHWATIPGQDGDVRLMDLSTTAAIADGLSKQDTAQTFRVDSTSKEQVPQNHMIVNEQTSVAVREAGTVASESLEISLAVVSDTTKEYETSLPAQDNDSTGLPSTNSGEKEEQSSNVTSIIKEDVKHVESRKASEKKSRKQKSSKAQTSEKKSSVQHSKQSQTEVALVSKSDLPIFSGLLDDDQEAAVDTKKIEDMSEVRREVKSSEYVEKQNATENSVHRVWKPTISVKPKSLLEIQQEEERRVKTESVVSAISSAVSTPTLSAPWTGVISGPEQKMLRANFQGVINSEINVLKTEDSIAKKSQLHDLLAAEVIAKSRENETVVVDAGFSPPSYPLPISQADTVDDDFIEAKDTKKSRKKAGKAKAVGSKPSTSISSVDAIVVSSPIEKGKSSRKLQQERELLPAPPVGPSLGDFVPWKGEASQKEEVNAPPAWSTDSGKLPKPTSLRDILVEEQRRGVPKQQQFTTPQKSQATQVSHTSKAAAPVQLSSQASPQTKYKGDDDLFWGPPEQSKQENRSRAEFPQLGNSGSWGTKSTPVKATSGASLTSQKSAGRKEFLSSPASAQSSLKVKRGVDTKHSEAMEFRCWCEAESVRLTGSNDMSFLEFCLKQSRSEAKILLTQNLGGVDPNHKFIEKFLDYMDMLPADILAIAFQGQNDHGGMAYSARTMTSDNVAMGDAELDLGSFKGGKKKGKKGKKVSLSALGFNVVSNRIMMGEIQTLDD